MILDMTTAELKLHEAGGRIAPREDLPGPVYKIRIMGWTPGSDMAEGSSAMYPVAALKASVPDAFPKGTRMRANHDGLCEDGGDITRLVGKTIDTPWAEADGMYTNIQASPNFAEVLERYADSIGVSISAAGEMETEQDENGDPAFVTDEATGKKVLKRLMTQEESPYNSIDFVEAPGADGRIVALVSEAKAAAAHMNVREQAAFASKFIESKTSGNPADEKNKGIDMDEATLRQILGESQAATVAAVDAKIAEALTPADPKDEAPKLEVVAEAIVSAGLTEGGRKSVYEKVELGMNLDAAIESEKAREDSIRKELGEKNVEKAPEGVVFTEKQGASFKEAADFEDKMDSFVPKGGRR